MVAVSPPALIWMAGWAADKGFGEVVAAAAWAWRVERVWSGVTVWLVWWPAWVVGGVVVASGVFCGQA